MTAERNKANMEGTVVCQICGHCIDRKLLQTHVAAEEYVLQQIRQEHPEWVEGDGACSKCWEDYRKLDAQIRPLRSDA